MGTKLNPGRFDCYANALADEPMFILLARDPFAPETVRSWATAMVVDGLKRGHLTQRDHDKANEAADCADTMIAWRAENEGRWREPVPAISGSSAGPGTLVEVRPDGWAGIEHEGSALYGFLYAGVRAAALGPDPRDPTKEVVNIVGGTQDPIGEVADAVTFAMSEAGLRALAASLTEAADRVRRRTVIDHRFVV